MKVFPGTVEPRSQFDKEGDLRDHVRYPEDLFKIQRTLLAKYHVKDPQAFFQGSQFWSVPADPTNDQADRQGLTSRRTTSSPQTPMTSGPRSS